MPISVITLGEPVRGTSIEIVNGISSTFFATNVGSGDGVFKDISGGIANFKSLTEGTGILLTGNANDISVAVDTSYITGLVNIGPVGYTLNRAIVTNGTTGALIVSATTSAEIGHLSGVTSPVQTQLNAKQATITGAATTVASLDLAANKALVSNASGKIAVATTTLAELNFLAGTTSLVQTQLNTLSAAIASAVLNPLAADLVVPSPYKISLASGAILLGQTGLTASGSGSIALNTGNISTNGLVGAYGGLTTGGVAIKVKNVQIGSWNMDSTSAKAVAHGVNYLNIRAVFVTILDDTGGSPTPLDATDSTGWVASFDATNINLQRTAAGFFDSTTYDSAAVNRGNILIFYEA